ncbi:hypothetical protein CQA53_06730 [Helicobacter didelphidarum]|uniref:HdrB-like C-terminal domain-containing protein n=1 Tax=Helicobacter didelphidarum TaxID=2040648 RepID=A0A3D8IKU3_9HELI|nr:hypothetical protein [Helicobacter didelphidarum]RDU65264.1 hypothetical protein CQA53_06730 [Helicobacter didelphidarum]
MYLIYDCLQNSPFHIATLNLLKVLEIPFKEIPKTESFIPNGGYYGRISKLDKFLFANIYNIALAAKNGDILLAIEEDSYANLAFTLNTIATYKEFRDFVSQELQHYGIMLDVTTLHKHVAYFPALLGKYHDKIQQNIVLHFGSLNTKNQMPSISARYDSLEGFVTCLYYTGRHFDCNMHGEYAEIHKIFKLLGLKVFETPFSMESFTHLLEINETKAYQKSGEILYAGIDLGVDFICVFGDSTFNMFEKKHNLCTKYCKRDNIDIAVLNLAQILLVAFGRFEEAGFDLHAKNPKFLWKDNSKVS